MHKITLMILLTASSYTYAVCNGSIARTAPDSRYELLNNNTEVKDKQTGLVWQRCSLGQTWNGTICTGSAATYIWANALQAAKNMGNGWRLPNVKELDSLVELACYNPAINETYFPNTISNNFYWSSSPVTYDSRSAWIVSFYDGSGYDYYNFGKHEDSYVRLVRSSQ